MDRNDFDELDQLFDRGLATYVGHEPLAGLEDRVLNRVHLASAARRNGRWRWALAVAAAAALIVVMLVPRSSRVPGAKPTPIPVPIPLAQVEKPSQAPVPSIVKHPRRRTPPMTSARALPKRDEFPTPTPVTPTERSVVALSELSPEAWKSLEEIRIEPIEIAPLQMDGSQ